MKLSKEQQQTQDALNALITKCWENESFKQQLIKSPVQTIEKFTGQPVSIPEGATLVVNDQTDSNYMHINIPAKMDASNVELTDEQLDTVSGGLVWLVPALGLLFIGYKGYRDGQAG